ETEDNVETLIPESGLGEVSRLVVNGASLNRRSKADIDPGQIPITVQVEPSESRGIKRGTDLQTLASGFVRSSAKVTAIRASQFLPSAPCKGRPQRSTS